MFFSGRSGCWSYFQIFKLTHLPIFIKWLLRLQLRICFESNNQNEINLLERRIEKKKMSFHILLRVIVIWFECENFVMKAIQSNERMVFFSEIFSATIFRIVITQFFSLTISVMRWIFKEENHPTISIAIARVSVVIQFYNKKLAQTISW